MNTRRHSLLSGRNQEPLRDDSVRRVANTFLGLEQNVNVLYEQNGRTRFRVAQDDTGEEYGEIVFGPDIYPGRSVIDPNSALSMVAAAAHELTHYHRWKDQIELIDESLEHIDEALTSLQAISRYNRDLNPHDIRRLVSDAIQRLMLYVHEITESREQNE